MSTYKTWVKGAHLLVDDGRVRRYTGLIPKISPLAVVTIALAQAKLDRMARHIPLEAPWTAKRAGEWDSRSVAWWLERSRIRTTIARDLFEMAVRGLLTGDLSQVSLLHLLFLVRSHGSTHGCRAADLAHRRVAEGRADLCSSRWRGMLGGWHSAPVVTRGPAASAYRWRSRTLAM